jgi:hypothetical protein
MESIFTLEYRLQLRAGLLERAKADARITGAAVTGSASAGLEDRWSDIDLAFGVANTAAVPSVLADWTTVMYDRHHAVHHMDLVSGAWTYRVFFLPNTLQVDLAFVDESDFRGIGPAFKLVHGKANESLPVQPGAVESLIGWGWLYALHARSCVARGKLWQAEYMISGVRDQALALACFRHGLSAVHGRGIDQLPPQVASKFESALVRSMEASELARAFRSAVDGLLSEIELADATLFRRLQAPMRALLDNPS